MRFLPLAILLGCASHHAPSPELSEIAQQLASLPDKSAVMATGSEPEPRLLGRDSDQLPIARVPVALGFVVEVWRDRLAALMDEASPQPREGSLMAVYDSSGVKADAYVVRVRGRLAFTHFVPIGASKPPHAGDRVAGVRR